MKKIVLTGGGTAGHVIPNLALIPHLSNLEIHYVGGSGMEKSLTQNTGVVYHEIPCVKLVRGKFFTNLAIPGKLLKSVSCAKKVLKEIKPDVIFSKGGFVGLPVALANKKAPLILHESDMTMGLANRLALKKAKLILTSFDTFDHPKTKHIGSPIRREIYRGNRALALEKCRLRDHTKPYLLVFGGSLGAQKINDAVFDSIDELTQKYNVIHVTGKNNTRFIKKENYFQTDFLENIADFFALADLVVSRGGSGSLFELMALSLPTLCIPLGKAASRGDQLDNAEYFRKKGCLEVLQEENLNGKTLFDGVNSVFAHQKSLRENMRKLSKVDGTRQIATIIRSYIE